MAHEEAPRLSPLAQRRPGGTPTKLSRAQIREVIRLKSAGRSWKEIATTIGCTIDVARHQWRLFTSTAYVTGHRARSNRRKRINQGLMKVFKGYKQREDLTKEERREIARRALAIEIEEAKKEIERRSAKPYKNGDLVW